MRGETPYCMRCDRCDDFTEMPAGFFLLKDVCCILTSAFAVKIKVSGFHPICFSSSRSAADVALSALESLLIPTFLFNTEFIFNCICFVRRCAVKHPAKISTNTSENMKQEQLWFFSEVSYGTDISPICLKMILFIIYCITLFFSRAFALTFLKIKMR